MSRVRVSTVVVQVVLLVAVFVSVAPLVVVWITSLKSTAELSVDPLGLPDRWLFSNFVEAWRTAHLGRYMFDSVLVTIPTVLIVLAAARLAGYAFAVFRFPGERLIFALFLIGLMVPSISVVVALYYTERSVGLVDSLPGLILAEAAQAMPLAVFIMRASFRDVPTELREAVLVDGGGDLTAFRRVLLPLAGPALAAAAVLAFLMVWNDYLLPLVLINTEPLRTVPLGLSYLRSSYVSNVVLIAASTSLASLPSILTYVLLQRQVVRGITQGALK